MKYPKYLEEHGTIGFVAPSFGCNIEPYRSGFVEAQRKFRQAGHELWLGPNCYEGAGIGISNTPEKCGQELMEAYCGTESDVLISCGGGELMCEILDELDFEKIKQAEPKWYMGFSDNTNFTFLLTTLADTASIYGPCAAAFGMEPWHPAIRDAYELLCGKKKEVTGYDLWEKEGIKDEEHPLAPYQVTEPTILHSFVGKESVAKVQMEGRLLGGCMDCLVNLLGTQYDKVTEFAERYKEDGIIWFLEACDLNVMSIRRAIWQMEHAGWFQYTKGFLIGRPLHFGEDILGLDQYHAVVDLLAHYNVPIIMDVDLGHLPPMMPIICGSKAEVAVQENQISICMREE